MRSATRVLLGALAFVLVAGSARAQNNVTFQVDMNPYITSCQFNRATQTVFTPGSMNGWNTGQYQLTDPDNNGVYSGTYSVPEGGITYKFYVAGNSTFSWENDPNRTYTVTPGAQTIPSATFNGPAVVNQCSATTANYKLFFVVDMSVQIGRGAFNPSTQTVAVAGSFTDWANAAVTMAADQGQAGFYSATIDVNNVTVPNQLQFKYIIRNNADNSIAAWENVSAAITSPVVGGNRALVLTGNEPVDPSSNRRIAFYDNDTNSQTVAFFSDQDATQFLTAPATVTYNVDARSAQYLLAATGSLPGGETTFTGLAINGPAAGESTQDGGPGGGIGDWAGWGATLAGIQARQLTNAGNNQWSITLNYPAGAARALVAKFGINGADNESGFGGDHRFTINNGANTVNLAFGCIRQANGTFIDETGDGGAFNAYDPYLLINNRTSPPTCVTVTSGGVAGDLMAVAGEGAPTITGLTIGTAYPNPVAGRAAVDLTLDRAMAVTVRLFDVTGRQVATLAEGTLAAGTTPVAVDASALSTGVYVLRVEADGQAVTRRLTVVR